MDPDHQGRGLGAYLVDAVDARWTGSTDRSDRILRLYEGEGMTVRREWHVVEKRLG